MAAKRVKVSRPSFHRALPKNLHLMPPRARVTRLCGATEGGYARQSERRWLKNFLAQGGRLCPNCARIAQIEQEPRR